MTLIVGVKCSNGIALAADTRISFGSAIQQDTAHKLDLVGKDIILGVSGSKAIAQEHLLELERQVQEHKKMPYRNVDEAKQFFAQALAGRFETIVERIKSSPLDSGSFKRLQHETLIACLIPNTRTTHLLYYDSYFVGTEINDFYPIQAIGSGTEAALFFGTFIRRMVYRNKIPTVRQGLIGAYWIVDMAIKCHTMSVGGNIDCACLRLEQNEPIGGLLTEKQIHEIREYLTKTEKRMAALFCRYPGSESDGEYPGLAANG